MRMLSQLKARMTSESGFAVPTVMLMTVAALAIAGVAVSTSVQSQSGTVRDQGSKSALAVAESGVSQALLHYNRGVEPCVPATEGAWCGPVTGMSVNGGEVSYWTRVATGESCEVGNEVQCVEVVSQGTFGGVTRRVNVMAATLTSEDGSGKGPFSTASVLSKETITLDSNSIIHTGTATNGDLELASNAKQCGQASVGIGKKMGIKGNAGYYTDPLCKTKGTTVIEQELTLPPVNQGDAATNNDNGRFFAQDVVSGNKADACWNKKDADGTSGVCGSRHLAVNGNSAVSLGGTVYSMCKLSLDSNSAVYITSGNNVTIYFDSPENCGQSSGVTQLDLRSNSRITSASGDPINLAMLFVGSESRQTKIQLNSNTSVNGPCEQNFVIYAPLSDVDLDSNSKFCGAIAGKSVHLDSNAEIYTASGSDDFTLPEFEVEETVDHYEPYRFVECTSTAVVATPDAGC
jgi:hypothetical protein